MNSYSDSGYQEVGSFHNSQNPGKGENRQQHSFAGANNNHLVRSSRAEGQALVQVQCLFSFSIPLADHLRIVMFCRYAKRYSVFCKKRP